jgi:hypothetical protein
MLTKLGWWIRRVLCEYGDRIRVRSAELSDKTLNTVKCRPDRAFSTLPVSAGIRARAKDISNNRNCLFGMIRQIVYAFPPGRWWFVRSSRVVGREIITKRRHQRAMLEV